MGGNYCHALKSDAPAPLATKVFYSQRNHRLRSALTYLYYEASFEEHSGDLVNQKTLNAMQLQVSSPKNFSYEQINVQRGKVCHFLFLYSLKWSILLPWHIFLDYYVGILHADNMDVQKWYPPFFNKRK